MTLIQKIKEFAKEFAKESGPSILLATACAGIILFSEICSKDSQILPSEYGGLSWPYRTELVDDPHLIVFDDNAQELPFDYTLLHGIGPGGTYMGVKRKPTREEINYWNMGITPSLPSRQDL